MLRTPALALDPRPTRRPRTVYESNQMDQPVPSSSGAVVSIPLAVIPPAVRSLPSRDRELAIAALIDHPDTPEAMFLKLAVYALIANPDMPEATLLKLGQVRDRAKAAMAAGQEPTP